MADRTRSSDRRHSPDVLAELLSPEPLGTPLPPAPDPQPKVESPRAAKRQSPAEPRPKPAAKPEPEPSAAVAPAEWEMEVVTFQEHRGWRPRYINGVELKNWLAGSLVHDYLQQRGSDGWELAGATAVPRFYGVSDSLQLYFKRRK